MKSFIVYFNVIPVAIIDALNKEMARVKVSIAHGIDFLELTAEEEA